MSDEKPKVSKKMMAAIVAAIIAFVSAMTGIDFSGEDEVLKRLDDIEAKCIQDPHR